MRNARTSPDVLLVFSCNGIDIIKILHLYPFRWYKCNFLIKKITCMSSHENTKRCTNIHLYIYIYIYRRVRLDIYNFKVQYIFQLFMGKTRICGDDSGSS
jgi:hypothetical protein